MSDGISDVVEDAPTITADTTAAAINGLADTIGEWADRKGFREDWEDASFIENMADQLVFLSAKLYTPADKIGTDYPQGLESHRKQADMLREVARTHRRLANVCKLMLMVSELSEALEGMRDGGNFGEELADLVIRVLENAHKNRVPIGDEIVKKVAVNESRPHKHGRKF